MDTKCPNDCKFQRIEFYSVDGAQYVDVCDTCGTLGDCFGEDGKPVMNLIDGAPWQGLKPYRWLDIEGI